MPLKVRIFKSSLLALAKHKDIYSLDASGQVLANKSYLQPTVMEIVPPVQLIKM